MELPTEKSPSWLDNPLLSKITLNVETILFALIVILAVISRLYHLGNRVMSHDENTHVYYSWRFFKGQGFLHDPLMHGPLQFHLVAATYFLFGDNDFTGRLSQALFSIATVAFMWFYRRYIGRVGALVAALLMLISPYMLYYGRYARNEAYVAFFVVVSLWLILRYLDTGQARYMYLLTTVTVLHYTSKETSFIFSAQALIFLAFYLIFRITKNPWPNHNYRTLFLIALIVGLLLLSLTGAIFLIQRQGGALSGPQTVAPSTPGQELRPLKPNGPSEILLILGAITLLELLAAVYFLVRGYSWKSLSAERSFALLIVQGTMVLPQLAAFPVRWAGWTIPVNATQVMALSITDIIHIAIFLLPLTLLAVAIGFYWNRREWLINAAIFYAIFTVFFTSLFTNGAGFFTGMVGSLGYWLEQQGVNRGSQPWYYYGLIQIPVYEYLPAIGTLLAFGIYFLDIRRRRSGELSSVETPLEAEMYGDAPEPVIPLERMAPQEEHAPVFPLLGFWAITCLVAFSVAGEKMPWLTVHITLPMILCAAWALDKLINAIDWKQFQDRKGWLVLALIPVLLLCFLATWGSLLGTTPPFQGKDLTHLQATSTFMVSLLTFLISGIGLLYLIRGWPIIQFVRLTTLYIFALLSVLTAHTAVQASFINYDDANELLVYAHSGPGVKVAMEQIEEISRRTTDGMGLGIAYDSETSYPFWWYLRNYTNVRFYGSEPTRSLRDFPVILVGDLNYGKIEAVVREDYDQFDYIRMWWPTMDYFDLTRERVWNALRDPLMRKALFQIWLNRDYTLYGQAVNRDMSLPNWSPSARFRLYIRKDIVTKLWNYGAAPAPETVKKDPFEGKQISLMADVVVGGPGNQPGQLQHPRDLAVAPDGSLYIADTENNRIQHLAVDGTVLQVWGTFADISKGAAEGGTFNQPWGIAVGSDGSVYVADTWNHRVQKFTPEGNFVDMWGYFGQAEKPEAFWGPRDVAVDANGLVYVTDTGNKRVVVFDAKGQFITQFGEPGLGLGEFDEPVGIAVAADGRVFVADTWNQRIQVFAKSVDGSYQSIQAWDVVAWFGQSLDNKPYLAVDSQGNLFVTDPEGYRVLWFTDTGQPLHFWGDVGVGLDQFGMPGCVAVDAEGGIWVSDTGNSRIVHFVIPAP
jgi:predicted membrane-bound mannosyltransferase/DNA-binding beta-propeller fold protein YncE